ncbi:MAG: hypothetical protein SangKO_050340 [Sandaracinaceae bacterium]
MTEATRTLEQRLAQMTPASRSFARALLDRIPSASDWLTTEPGEDGELLFARIPSPTGDPAREIVVWMESDEPSLAFGEWHTHATVWASPVDADPDLLLVELLEDILYDRIVLCDDVSASRWPTVVDLRDPDAVLGALTEPHDAGEVRLRSWRGTTDAQTSLD